MRNRHRGVRVGRRVEVGRGGGAAYPSRLPNGRVGLVWVWVWEWGTCRLQRCTFGSVLLGGLSS